MAVAIQSFQVLDLGKVCGDGISPAETKHEATVLRFEAKEVEVCHPLEVLDDPSEFLLEATENIFPSRTAALDFDGLCLEGDALAGE